MRGEFAQLALLEPIAHDDWVLARISYPQIGQARGTYCARLYTSKNSPSARAITITIASRHAQSSSSSRPRFLLTTPLTRFVPTIMSADQSSPAIDAKALEAATDIHVFDKKGGKVRFGDLFADQKTVVVFVRAYDVTRAAMRTYIHVDLIVCLKGIFSVGYVAASFSVAVLCLLIVCRRGGFRVAWCVISTLLCLIGTNAHHSNTLPSLPQSARTPSRRRPPK